VLRPGRIFAGSDSIASEDLCGFHDGDIYPPVDPESLASRLGVVGFTATKIQFARDGGWFACSARPAPLAG